MAVFIDEFRAKMVAVDLARAGAGVGGRSYLTPNDFEGIGCYFSPGIDVKAGFDVWLGETHGIRRPDGIQLPHPFDVPNVPPQC